MTSGPLDFSKYQRPHFEEPNHELTHKRAVEGDEAEMPTENFGVRALSERVMQMTASVSESVEKVRGSADQ